MYRPLRLVFISAAAFLLLLPLAVARPGMPLTLKADEPAYFAAALSLAYDGDLVCDEDDLRRLFDRYPLLPIENLILMSDDGWQTTRFGKPYLFSLLVAPAAAAFGARGVVASNMALFLGLLVIGYRTLRRYNDDALAAIFTSAFFFLSPAFIYVFWLQPEVLSMLGIAACLYLGLIAPERADAAAARSRWSTIWTSWLRPAASAAALSVAVYHKPMFAFLGLPVLWALARRRQWRQVAAWLSAAVVSMAAIAGLSILLSGAPSAYLGNARAGVKIEDPERFAETLAPLVVASQSAMAADERPLASFGWLIRIPKLFPRLLKENLGYFLWGRHTGLLLYMPFAVLAVLLFLINSRSSERWVLLASTGAVALFFLIWIHYNWHGGAGFIGNRYFASVYPAFLFLVTRVRPAWSIVAGAGAGGLFLAPILFTPYGAPVPDPTLQTHARGAAFERFPTELTLGHKLPGYDTMTANGVAFRARQDLAEMPVPGGSSLWVRGAADTEIWALAAQPLDSLLFGVSTPAGGNRIRFQLNDEKKILFFPATDQGEPDEQLLELTPKQETKTWVQYGKRFHGYRLRVSPKTGRNPTTSDGVVIQPAFYLGARLTYLGTRSELDRKAYHQLTWGEPELPSSVAAGERFQAAITVRNDTPAAWPVDGVLAVRLRHRWLDGNDAVLADSESTALARQVTPGSWAQVFVPLRAPEQEGSYVLEFDLEREGLTLFSAHGTGLLAIDVEVAL